MTELAFHPKYVAPFYMDLMKLNFLSKSIEETEKLFDSLIEVSKQLEDEKLVEMLNDSWRPSKVSAWIIGVSNRIGLIEELEFVLNKKGVYHSEHILLNLLILKGENSNQSLINFIYRQIDYLIETDNKLVVENLSIEWAISILGYLDKLNGITDLKEVYESEKWANFEKTVMDLKFYDAIKPIYGPTYYQEEITDLMERMKRG